MGALAMIGTSPLLLWSFSDRCKTASAEPPNLRCLMELGDGFHSFGYGKQTQRESAAIDGVGSRIGKSGGSLIHQGLLVIFASISASAHIVAGILLVVMIAVWLVAVFSLGKQFNELANRTSEATQDSDLDLEPTVPAEEEKTLIQRCSSTS